MNGLALDISMMKIVQFVSSMQKLKEDSEKFTIIHQECKNDLNLGNIVLTMYFHQHFLISFHPRITWYHNELENNTKFSTSFSNLNVLLNKDISGKLTTKLYNEWNDYNFVTVNLQCLCSTIPLSCVWSLSTDCTRNITSVCIKF